MSIEVKSYGVTKDGQEVKSYILKNKTGMQAEFIDYGATLVRLLVPDRKGELADIVLGYEALEGYEKGDTYFGAFVGRNCNRIGGAKIVLNEKEYQLEKNDNSRNNLHSGKPGYQNWMYAAEIIEGEHGDTVEFSRVSPDGEQGFPGNLDVSVAYTLTGENELVIEYLAVPDADTVVNLTNHTYFNLAGHASGSVLEHEVTIYAEKFTPTDAELIPTGELLEVAGTPLDFRKSKKIGQDINAAYEPLLLAGGYDHNYVLHETSEDMVELAARAEDETSGRGMEVYTNRPGIQFYTGNFLDNETGGKNGCTYQKHGGFCMETQAYPDTPNKPAFPETIVRAGEKFDSTTIYRFYFVP